MALSWLSRRRSKLVCRDGVREDKSNAPVYHLKQKMDHFHLALNAFSQPYTCLSYFTGSSASKQVCWARGYPYPRDIVAPEKTVVPRQCSLGEGVGMVVSYRGGNGKLRATRTNRFLYNTLCATKYVIHHKNLVNFFSFVDNIFRFGIYL